MNEISEVDENANEAEEEDKEKTDEVPKESMETQVSDLKGGGCVTCLSLRYVTVFYLPTKLFCWTFEQILKHQPSRLQMCKVQSWGHHERKKLCDISSNKWPPFLRES